MRERVLVSWSGGKDSALALYDIAGSRDVAALLTTVTEDYDRVSMHGVRTELLRRQAAALGHPLETVLIPPGCCDDDYERCMRAALERHQSTGVTGVVCGDLFLEDIRRYREERLFSMGLKGIFPLWLVDTRLLAQRFLELGFRAVLCCVDTQALDASFAGRAYDFELLADLPPGVDPCGENGEFHTFVWDGPGFASPISWRIGELVVRDNRFAFRDLLPVD
jgi:uncharacterized protein (TIGR00290 family)